MRRNGLGTCVPRPERVGVTRSQRPILDLSSGYVMRAAAGLPKQRSKRPWKLRQNYLLELPTMRLSRVADSSLEFRRVGARTPAAAAIR